MTKRQTRLFFIVGTLVFAGIFLALTIAPAAACSAALVAPLSDVSGP